jgi:hypothetical protein
MPSPGLLRCCPQAKRKYDNMLQQKNTLDHDIQELQQKYNQKAS